MPAPPRISALSLPFCLACVGAVAAAAGLLAGSAFHDALGPTLELALAAVVLFVACVALATVLPRVRATQRAARDSNLHRARFEAIGDATSDAFLLLEPVVLDGVIVDFRMAYLNQRALSLFKLPEASLHHGRLCDLLPFFRRERLFDHFRSMMEQDKPSTTEFSVRDAKIAATWLRSTAVRFEHGLALSLTNLTEQKDFESRLCHFVHHDPLTGLPNRTLLDERLQHAMALARRSRHIAAVLMLDLDGFKDLNERHGHAAGDHVLKTIASRLRSSVRASDGVFRLGGDEFVIVFGELAAKRLVADFARKIVLSLLSPVDWHGTAFDISASIGFAVFPDDATTPEAMLVQADMQMYRMKRAHLARHEEPIRAAADAHEMTLDIN
jgi:diguanylate cyclase (GGDEF)-like protein